MRNGNWFSYPKNGNKITPLPSKCRSLFTSHFLPSVVLLFIESWIQWVQLFIRILKLFAFITKPSSTDCGVFFYIYPSWMIGFYAGFAWKAKLDHKMETIIAGILAASLHLLAWGAYKVKKYSRRAIPLKTIIMIFSHVLWLLQKVKRQLSKDKWSSKKYLQNTQSQVRIQVLIQQWFPLSKRNLNISRRYSPLELWKN